jgi:hypothetical protein
MNGDEEKKDLVRSVISRAEEKLRKVEFTSFSPAAFKLLKTNVSKYVSDLVNESLKIANRHRGDTVSAAHVERAADHLVSSTSRRLFRHLGSVGGIALGAALSNLFFMTPENTSPTRLTVTVLAAVAGAFFIALHIARE